MPYKEHKVEKIYWSIGEVGKLLGIAISKIRFWEDKGLIKPTKMEPHPNPSTNMSRMYNKKACNRLRLINCLRQFGIEIKLIRQALQNEYAQDLADYLNRMK